MLLILLFAAVLTRAQTDMPAPHTAPAQPTSKAQYFSGNVVDMPTGSLTVSRKNGAMEVRHTFQLGPLTVVEGALHIGARVTVRYMPVPDGTEKALHILVRAAAKS